MGAKLWPVFLLPVILRPVLLKPKKLIPAVGLFSFFGWILFLPVYSSGLDSSSGFIAYGRNWEMNDALFMLLQWSTQSLLMGANFLTEHSQLVTRAVVLVLLVVWIFWLARREAKDPTEFSEKCLWAIAGIFFLSPTQLPWYYVWLLPMLAIRPRRSLLILTALLPLYYLRFYFDARDQAQLFDLGVVWLEYAPVWFLLFREW